MEDSALTAYQKFVVDWDALTPSDLSETRNNIYQEYDGLNRIRKAVYPEDVNAQRKEMIPMYNKGGALLSLELDGTDYVREVAYNARGQRILIAYGNNIMTRYAYDPETFRVARQRSALYTHNGLTYTPNAGIRQDLQYTYDLEGTIKTINDAAPANTYAQGPGDLLRRFTHDPLRRLLSATGRENSNVYSQPSWDLNIRPQDYTTTNTYTRSYQYDKIGNIQKLTHLADGHANQNFSRDYAYDSSDNKLKSFTVNSTTYGNNYDANGSLTKEGQSRYYEWGANDKLSVFKNQAGNSTPSVYTNYFYNAQGERVKKHTRKGNKIIVTVYMDGGMFETTYTKTVGGSIDNDRHFNTIKIQDNGALIATMRIGNNVDDSTPAIKYIVGDHLNNSSAVVKTTGGLVNREEYYPFGETSYGSFQYKRYRYNGKEKDEESGLYEYGQRYYAPWLCRFVSVDPIAEDYPQYTSYNYAGNKPVSKVDLEGLQEEDAKPVDQGRNDVNLENPEKIKDGSKMPNNKNVHNAPERTDYEGVYGRDYKETENDTAGSASDDGYINTHNPQYLKKIYWNPDFKRGQGKGAYFWQKIKVEPRVKMQKVPLKISGVNITQNLQLPKPNKMETPPTDNPNRQINLRLNQNNVVAIDHLTDGNLLVDENNSSHQLDDLIQDLKSMGNQVGSITINAQIGIGRAANTEMTFSQNLFENVANYIHLQLPDILINRGYVGPASGTQRISKASPLSIYINP